MKKTLLFFALLIFYFLPAQSSPAKFDFKDKSSTSCSNEVEITVHPVLTGSVSISAVPNTPICAGTPVTFPETTQNQP